MRRTIVAELAHEAVAAQAGHQVDGVRPAFVSAGVDGSSLTLTYGEALDGGSRPATGDFTVEVEGSWPKRFGSLDQRERGDADAQPGGRARRYGDPGELHGSDGSAGRTRSGMRWAMPGPGAEQPVGDQYHGGAQHGPGDYQSEFVRCSRRTKSVARRLAATGQRRGGRGDGLGDCGRGRPVSSSRLLPIRES